MNEGFPFGCTTTKPGNGGWGPSWIVYLLPMVEQDNMFRQLNLNTSMWSDATNNIALHNFSPKVLSCPSSPLPNLTLPGDQGNPNPSAVANPVNGTTNYVGIAGASNDVSNRRGTGNGGIVSGGGVLFPNSRVKIAGITDGTSNTLVIGEQSDFLFGPGNSKNDWRASIPHGAFMGFNQNVIPNASGTPSGDNRAFNTTTIRYEINDVRNKTNVGGGTPGVWNAQTAATGVGFNMGNNTPLNSAHSGGVMCLLGDGSVRFMRDSVPLATLQLLATRDDGQVVQID